MTENEIGAIVVECAIAVHRELGPGTPISLRLSVSAGEISACPAELRLRISAGFIRIRF